MSAYLRKMAIDGYIIQLDIPTLRELVRLMHITANNVNQIARRVNETRNIYILFHRLPSTGYLKSKWTRLSRPFKIK